MEYVSQQILPGAGSKRRYSRITDSEGRTFIRLDGISRTENHAFLVLNRQMEKAGIRVPHVFEVSDDGMSYIQEDLGSRSLYDCIARCQKQGTWDDETRSLVREVMSDLPAIQFRTAEGLDFSVCFPVPEFTRDSVMWDLNYFKYCFLKVAHLDIDEPRLEDEFRRFADVLLSSDTTRTFLYRDFQSRNIMVRDGHPWYIDFQGGRRGPIYYDVASFVWQARAAYPEDFKRELVETYKTALQTFMPLPPDFDRRLRQFVFFRMLQVLGAYGFLGLIEHKAMFLTSIPGALSTLNGLIQTGEFEEYPTLRRLIAGASALDKFRPQPMKGERLTVLVRSFSFRKGIPEDYTGNGGGFVFDCRAPHNPGRYPEYRNLTGLDRPVIDFLEQQGEIQPFLSHVYGLVDPAVETYVRRGFTSLMVSFGCTGGQHRSVYCAQHLADHLREKYPDINVELHHREQE